MTNDSQNTNEFPSTAFGARLQSAREALGLDTKDAAARLRLNEKVILMMEKERYASDLPITFIRGYIRAYGKLLQIPDHEIKKALEPIQPKPAATDAPLTKPQSKKTAQPVTSENYSMRISTYLIAFTMVGLVGAWWYTHNPNKEASTTTTLLTDNQQLLPVPSDTIQPSTQPLALNTPPLTASNEMDTPSAQAPALPATQVNVNSKTGQTTVTDGTTDQTTVIQNKPASKQKVVPQNNDDEEYDDDSSD